MVYSRSTIFGETVDGLTDSLDRQQFRGFAPIPKRATAGFGGAGVLEIVEDDDGSTYRAVYTVKFAGVVYVLHAFQKKSKKGIRTPRHEMNLVKKRLQDAREDFREH